MLVAANMVPLAGVFWWGWDAFLLLVLYWTETAAIGVWTLVQAMALQFDGPGKSGGLLAALGLGAFLTVHAGLFMTVHMIFLWSLYAGPWEARVHGPEEFIRIILIATGLWIPLVALFAARGIITLTDVINRFVFARKDIVAPKSVAEGAIIGRFYLRIVIMHVAILIGGIVALFLGSLAPLIVLVLVKTAIDLGLHLKFASQPA